MSNEKCFNGLSAKMVADWLALNPDNVEVTKALAMCFAPVVTSHGTIAFDTGMMVKDVFGYEDNFIEFCEDNDNSEEYY